jgi:hypothetical protein
MKNGMKYFVKTLVEPTLDYELVMGFREGLAMVRNNYNDRKMGFIDKTGKVVIPVELYDGFSFTASSPPRVEYIFSEGLCAILKDGKCGFMDKTGEIVILPEYEFVCRFSEGLAGVQKDGKWGFIDKTGKTVLPFEYDCANPFNEMLFSEGLAAVKKDGKFGYIDKTGEAVIPFGLNYDFADCFQEGLARVMTGKGVFMPHIPRLENESYEEHSKRAFTADVEASKNDRWGFIDRTGKLQIPLEYSGCHRFSEGLVVSVTDNHKCSYIDQMGNTPFQAHFDRLGSFREGLATVLKGCKWGFIDKDGVTVIPFSYNCGSYFSEGLAAVKMNDKWGYIDKTGNVVIPFEYNCVCHVSEGLAVVSKDDKWGILQIEEND